MNMTLNRFGDTSVADRCLIRSGEWRDLEVCDFSIHGTPGLVDLSRRNDPTLDGQLGVMSKEFGRLVGDRIVRNALGGDARSTSLALRACGKISHDVNSSAGLNEPMAPELAAAMLAAVVAILDGPAGDPTRPEAGYLSASQATPLPFAAHPSLKIGRALRTSGLFTPLPVAGLNPSGQ